VNIKQIIPKKKSMVRWEPPPVNWLKINVDGSLVPTTGSASVGAVIRDHCGYVIAGAVRVLEKCSGGIRGSRAPGRCTASCWMDQSTNHF
jgi:hypothetical protein